MRKAYEKIKENSNSLKVKVKPVLWVLSKNLWAVSIRNFGSLSDVVYYVTMTLHVKPLSIIHSCQLISQTHQGNPKTSQRGSTCLLTWTPSPTQMPSANLTQSMNYTQHSSS